MKYLKQKLAHVDLTRKTPGYVRETRLCDLILYPEEYAFTINNLQPQDDWNACNAWRVRFLEMAYLSSIRKTYQ